MIDLNSYTKEVIGGNVYYMLPGLSVHIKTISRLSRKFNVFFESTNKECAVYTEGLEVYLDPEDKENYVVPDLSIICDNSKFIERGYNGAPELIVEVLSAKTAKKDKEDKEDKLLAYEKFSVKEYWIVDIKNKSIEQRILVNGKYKLENYVVIMNKAEYNKLTEEEKNSYTTKIKPSLFPDLEIDLNQLFDFSKL